MTLDILKQPTDQYARRVRVHQSALTKLVAGSSDRNREIQPAPKVKVVQWPSAHMPQNMGAALSDSGLLGSSTLRSRSKRPSAFLQPVQEQLVLRFQGSFNLNVRVSQSGEPRSWIDDVLTDLESIDAEAAEDDLPPRSKLSKQNARRILRELAKGPYPAPTVYPTDDGEIAILFQKRSAKAGVLVLCDYDGGGAWFSTIAGKKRRARSDEAEDLPDASLKNELLKLRVA